MLQSSKMQQSVFARMFFNQLIFLLSFSAMCRWLNCSVRPTLAKASVMASHMNASIPDPAQPLTTVRTSGKQSSLCTPCFSCHLVIIHLAYSSRSLPLWKMPDVVRKRSDVSSPSVGFPLQNPPFCWLGFGLCICFHWMLHFRFSPCLHASSDLRRFGDGSAAED